MNMLLVDAESSFQEKILSLLVHFISIQDTNVLKANDEAIKERS